MAVSIPDAYAQHVTEAWSQLAAGRRPSADSVVSAVGGSKTTANAAMNYFWKSYMPDMMSGRDTNDTPDPIQKLANNMWQTALKLATKTAENKLTEQRQSLAQQAEAMDTERRQMASERLEHQVMISDVRAEANRRRDADLAAQATAHNRAIDKLETRNTRLEQTIAELQDSLTNARNEAADAKRALADNAPAIAALQAKVSAAEQLAAERQSALQAERMSAEAAMRAISAERAAQAEQNTLAMDTLRGEHQAKLDALNTHHNRAIEELKLQHVARTDDLKRQINQLQQAATRRNARQDAKGPKDKG
ncbi:DNA-binding protein [Pseudoxanthomonas sp. LjRoot168]|uniref:DNA-binding protein n=1 Tax=unclassified Pseudoxanthomonas TaxID=2645906 RepID=UPI003ECF17F4